MSNNNVDDYISELSREIKRSLCSRAKWQKLPLVSGKLRDKLRYTDCQKIESRYILLVILPLTLGAKEFCAILTQSKINFIVRLCYDMAISLSS